MHEAVETPDLNEESESSRSKGGLCSSCQQDNLVIPRRVQVCEMLTMGPAGFFCGLCRKSGQGDPRRGTELS